MASEGQYQSFALIAYSALKMQLLNVNEQISQGCNEGDCVKRLYLAKNVIDSVFNYSVGCMSVVGVLESDILTMCDWLTTTLNFTTTPINQLEETILNWIGGDFNTNDFNPLDFN